MDYKYIIYAKEKGIATITFQAGGDERLKLAVT